MVVRRRSALGVEPSALRVADASDIGYHPFTPLLFLSLVLILLYAQINTEDLEPFSPIILSATKLGGRFSKRGRGLGGSEISYQFNQLLGYFYAAFLYDLCVC